MCQFTQNTRILAATAAVILSSGLVQGCGNLANDAKGVKMSTTPQSSGDISFADGASMSSSDGFSCASTPQILPYYDWNIDGTERYRTCTNPDLPQSVRVYGLIAQTKTNGLDTTICAFPAQVTQLTDGRTKISVKPDPNQQNLFPMYQCLSYSKNGMAFDFEFTDYNALFIVKSQDRVQMGGCLLPASPTTGQAGEPNVLLCPKEFSWGRFR